MKIQTGRLVLRRFTEEDFDDFAALMADPAVMQFSTAGPYSRETSRNFFDNIVKQHQSHGYSLLAVCDKDDVFLGYAGFFLQNIDGEELVELGYRLFEKAWGKGLATEAASALRLYAFEELKLPYIVSIIDPSNHKSIKVAEKAGLKKWKESSYKTIPVHIYRLENQTIRKAMQKNMHLHMTYLAQYIPMMELIEAENVTVVRSHIQDDTFNYVIGASFNEDNVSNNVKRVIALFKENGLSFSWWLRP